MSSWDQRLGKSPKKMADVASVVWRFIQGTTSSVLDNHASSRLPWQPSPFQRLSSNFKGPRVVVYSLKRPKSVPTSGHF